MSFTPIIPFGGYAGWSFLNRTVATQTDRLADSPQIQRDMAYFRENIGKVGSAADLVNDYRLRKVALTAFGLQDDLPNRAFVERVLADGTSGAEALSNRLADKRYRAFSEAFGFGSPLPPKTQSPGFADRILSRFQRQEFEQAVGEQSQDMRLALAADREIRELASRGLPDTTAWLSVLGNPPLRKVFETAFGLPTAVGTLDLDRQIGLFRDSAQRNLGTSDFSQIGDDETIDDLMRLFTIRSQVSAGPSFLTPGMSALSLLQGAV